MNGLPGVRRGSGSQEAEVLVDQFHRHGAFAYAGGDAFGGPMADIAGDKDSWNARLEVKRVAIRSPPGGTPAFKHQVLTGNQITLRIPLDHPGEPIRAGNRARVNQ